MLGMKVAVRNYARHFWRLTRSGGGSIHDSRRRAGGHRPATEITTCTQVELRLVRDKDNAVLFSSKGFVDAPNPLATVDLLFTMQGVRFPEPGQYAFELLAVTELLGRRRFQLFVRRRPQPGQHAETPRDPGN